MLLLVLPCFFGLATIIELKSFEKLQSKLQHDFWPTLKFNWCIWPAANFISFKFIPIDYRILYLSVLGFFWNTILVTMTNRTVEKVDGVQNSKENFQLDVYASNIVFASETLLKMITELKHSILVNDFETMNENVDRQAQQIRSQNETVGSTIQKLNHELSLALYELETEYFSSHYNL